MEAAAAVGGVAVCSVVAHCAPADRPPITLITPRLFPTLPSHSAAAYSVKTVLQSIQSLLADPNVDSPLNTHAAKLWGVNNAAYRALVQSTYNGPKAA